VRFTRFFHNTPMAIAAVDQQSKIKRSNALFARVFHPVLKGEGTADRSILDVVAERDRGVLEAAIRKAGEGQGEIAPVDAALEGAGERFARFYVTAIKEEERDQEAAIVYALETTEQRHLQGQVDTAQTMELVGKLAGGVAHDFNNVLGAIIMATDFLLNAHKPTDPSFQDIMQIKQNANRAAALVRQLLAFSRRQTLRPEVVDLNESLSDLGMLLRRFLGEKIALNVVPSRDLYPVKIDIAQFERSIINLAANSRDAMTDGGRFTLRTSNLDAEESARFQYKGMPIGEYVLVEVQDTGVGIAPEIVDRIFQPYFTTKDVGKGTGLGLSTVYGFVKQTGGFIYVETELGKGSTFRIFLPRYVAGADDAQVPHLPESAAPAIAGAIAAADEVKRTAASDLTGEGTILLVEDEEGLRALNARGLASRGYTVIEASNGVEALEKLEKRGGQVDLVVSDVVMPEMDGPTLFKELRRRIPDVKVIFVSGYAEDAFEKSLPGNDRPAFLPKPFTLKQLVATVKETMAN
jgi:two-component system, cell cycle sensor histidine kinase and response regulator CckA